MQRMGGDGIFSLKKAVRVREPAPTRIRTIPNNKKNHQNNIRIRIIILMVSSLGLHLYKTDGVVVAVAVVTSMQARNARRRRA